jgi:hypothetical protein
MSSVSERLLSFNTTHSADRAWAGADAPRLPPNKHGRSPAPNCQENKKEIEIAARAQNCAERDI